MTFKADLRTAFDQIVGCLEGKNEDMARQIALKAIERLDALDNDDPFAEDDLFAEDDEIEDEGLDYNDPDND